MTRYKIERKNGSYHVFKFLMQVKGNNLFSPMLDEDGNEITFSSNPEARKFLDKQREIDIEIYKEALIKLKEEATTEVAPEVTPEVVETKEAQDD